MQIEDLKKTIRKAEDKNNSVKNVVKNKFLLSIKNIFRNKNISKISWSQYTPYFNDGEECVFTVSDITITVNKEFKEHIESVLNSHLEKSKIDKKALNQYSRVKPPKAHLIYPARICAAIKLSSMSLS
jgi:hypothetical protein